ncbi:MAG: hypothetical protein ABF291_08700 [Desulfobacterales bacterium]
MLENDQEKLIHRPAGYAALVDRYDLDVIPNWHNSLVTTSGIHRLELWSGVIEEVYPPKYWPGDTLGDHLEFALKYDGTNLAILAGLFQKAAKEDFLEYVRSKPTGRSIFSFVSASKTTGDSLRGNARATSASCRMMKSSAWNKPFNLPVETPPQVLNKKHEGNRRVGSAF